jgi:hypothetical protein
MQMHMLTRVSICFFRNELVPPWWQNSNPGLPITKAEVSTVKAPTRNKKVFKICILNYPGVFKIQWFRGNKVLRQICEISL